MTTPLIDSIFALASWTTLAVLAALLVIHILGFRAFKKYYEHRNKDINPQDPYAETFDGFMGGYAAAQAPTILNAFTEVGRAKYKQQILKLDLTFPLVYSLFAAAWIAIAAKYVGERALWWVLLPFGAALFDYLENFAVLSMLNSYDEQKADYGTPARVAAVATRVKWLFIGASLCAMLILTAAAIVRNVR